MSKAISIADQEVVMVSRVSRKKSTAYQQALKASLHLLMSKPKVRAFSTQPLRNVEKDFPTARGSLTCILNILFRSILGKHQLWCWGSFTTGIQS
jgi:hypothetical protein